MEQIELKVRSSSVCPKPLGVIALPPSGKDGTRSTLGVHRPADVPRGAYAKRSSTKQPVPNDAPTSECMHEESEHKKSQLEQYLQLLFSESEHHRHLALVEIRRMLLPNLRSADWSASPLAEFLADENRSANMAILFRCMGDRYNSVSFEALHLLAGIVENRSEVHWMLLCEGIAPLKFERPSPNIDYRDALFHTYSQGRRTSNSSWATCGESFEDILSEQSTVKSIIDFLKRKTNSIGTHEHLSVLEILSAAATRKPQMAQQISRDFLPDLIGEWVKDKRLRHSALRLLYILCKNVKLDSKIVQHVSASISECPIGDEEDTIYIIMVIICLLRETANGAHFTAFSELHPVDSIVSIAEKHRDLMPLVQRYKMPLGHDKNQTLQQSDISTEAIVNLTDYMATMQDGYLFAYLELVAISSENGLTLSITHGQTSSFMRNDLSKNSSKRASDILLFTQAPQALSWWPVDPPESLWRMAASLEQLFHHLRMSNVAASNMPELFEITLRFVQLVLSKAICSHEEDENGSLSQTAHFMPFLYSNPKIASFIEFATHYERKVLSACSLWLLKQGALTSKAHHNAGVHFAIHQLSAKQTALLCLLWFPCTQDNAVSIGEWADSLVPMQLYPKLHAHMISHHSVNCTRLLELYTILPSDAAHNLFGEWVDWYFSLVDTYSEAPLILGRIDGHSVLFRFFFVLRQFSALSYTEIPGAYRLLKYLCRGIQNREPSQNQTPVDITDDIVSDIAKLVVTDSASEYLVATLTSALPFLNEDLIDMILKEWASHGAISFIPKGIVGEPTDFASDNRVVILDFSRAEERAQNFSEKTTSSIEATLQIIPKGAQNNGLLGTLLKRMIVRKVERDEQSAKNPKI